MKKKILLLLSLCTLAVNSQLIQAETVSTPSSVITSSQNSAISGQLSVVEEDGQMKAVLSDVTGEITGVTAQFSSTQNTGYEISFHLDEHGRYVTMLDRSHFPPDDENFSLDALVQLKDGTSQQLTRYDFKWVKDAEEAFARPEEVESEYTKDSAISSRSIMSYETKAKQESTLSQEVSSNSVRSVQAQSSNDTVTSVSPATPTGSISVSNIDANSGSFDVRITNVSAPRGLAKVLVPTWTEVNGQDDILWYEALLQSDGSYLLRVNKSRHKYGTGKYNIHVYYQGQDSSMNFAGATTVDLPEVKLSGSISVSNIDANSGSFDVRITNVSAPRGLAKVLVPTWTEVNGQDDILWYEALLQSDGSYLLRVNKSRHKYGTG
ncbi:GBS Bsp-like repeat-containing protein, partial [Streptococcus suis]|nr:GBS Bsp-like repeat-containing protein [Streptococcus suis]